MAREASDGASTAWEVAEFGLFPVYTVTKDVATLAFKAMGCDDDEAAAGGIGMGVGMSILTRVCTLGLLG